MPFQKGNAYRFEKGKDGGPGRPVGSVSINDELRRKLKEKVAGDKEGRTYLDALVTKIMALAMGDDSQILKQLWDQMEGKAKQQMGVDMNIKNSETTFIIKPASEAFGIQVDNDPISEDEK